MTKKRRASGSDGDAPRDDGPDLLADLGAILSDNDPLSLVQMASSVLCATAPRRQTPFEPVEPVEPVEPDAPDLQFLLDAFAGSDDVRTESLARAIVTLSDDELMHARVMRQLPNRKERLDWVDSLPQTEVVGAMAILDSVRDGANIAVAVRFSTGDEVTVVSYIDFNLNAALKDSFAVPASLEEFGQLWGQLNEDPGAEIGPIPLADARERLRVAIANGRQTWPPLESETWPQSRPLLEWLLRLMPEGGADFAHPTWTDRQQATLTKEFFADPLGRPFDDRDHRAWTQALLDYRTGYGFGDPLRWSPASVEALLMDFVPRKLMADDAFLLKLPRLLTSFITFVHARSGVAGSVAELTLQALDELTPEYVAAIASPSAASSTRSDILAWATENLDDLDFAFDIDDVSGDLGTYRLRRLEGQVGGHEALEGLDTVPLPDEPFDAEGVPDDIRPRVQSILSLAEAACDEFFDPEHARAVRRLLHDVAVDDPAIFRRRSKDNTAAAALCWIVGKVNDDFHLYGSGVEVQDLMEHFGLTGSPSSRATTLVRAIGGNVDFVLYGLNTTRYLTSQTRAQLIQSRDDIRQNP